jgi:large subunit ribosomal protein L3
MPGLIGRKLGMTQLFTEDGKSVGVTVLEVGPCPVLQVRARAGLDYVPEVLAEFELGDQEVEPGQELTVDMFEVGSRVKISGPTKGRGFQGVVKRHGFGGGRGSHGGTSIMRAPGSIGPGTDPSRVIKGRKMAGRMGGETRTAMNRRVERVDTERNLLLIRGSVPGSRNNIVFIRTA